MNRKIFGIFVVSIVILGFSIFPAIQGIKNSSIIEKENGNQFDKNDFNIVEFMKKMKNQDVATSDEVFYEIKNYLNLNNKNIEPSLSYFNFLCDRIKNKIGEDKYNIFLSFLEMMLQYLNSNDMTIKELYSSFNNEMKSILTELDYVLDGTKSEYDFFAPIEDLLKIYKTDTTNSQYLGFLTYWEKYTWAKCYWAGYFPLEKDEGPGPDVNFNINTKYPVEFWCGDNFYDWSEEAAKFIVGTEDKVGTAQFWLLNQAAFGLLALLLVVSIPIYALGIFTLEPVYFGLSGMLSLFGIIVLGLLMAFDWLTLVYFLFGTNAYLECQRYGNVEFMVHVIDENGSEINTSCIVNASSKDAFDELDNGNPLPDFKEVNWSKKEFVYQMKKVANYNGVYNIFCLQSSSKSAEKWEKAVPPPGIWSFTVNASGYEDTIYVTEEKIERGECFNITIPLKKL